jgi:hypothetical protein
LKIKCRDGSKQDAARYYSSGLSLRATAVLSKVSHVTVNTWLDELGVPRRNGQSRVGLGLRNLCGRRFGRLKVIERDGLCYPTRWIAVCDCGSVKSYRSGQLHRAKSCGCGPRGRFPEKGKTRRVRSKR